MTTITWMAGVSGDWTVGTNWEGSLAPSSTQDAAILAGNADTYSTATVESGDDVSVAGLVIGPATSTSGPTPMVVVVGTLAVAGVITLDGGLYLGTNIYAFAATGGELVGGTVDVASGEIRLVGSELSGPSGNDLVEGATLDGVAIDATGSLSLPGAALVVGGLTVTATTLAAGLLEFAGTQVLSAQTVEGADFTVAGTLTLAASDVLTGGFTFGSGDNSRDDLDAIVNDGTIAAAPSFDLLAGLLNNGLFVAAGTNEVDSQNIGNAGTLELTEGASLTIGTDNANATHILTNTGLIQIVAGSTLTLDNDAGLGDAGNTDPASDNAGGTVEIDAGGALSLQAGLSAGTIVSRGGTIGSDGSSGTLEDAALTGSVVVVGLTIDPLTTFAGSMSGSRLELDDQGIIVFSGAENAANLDLTLDSGGIFGESSVTLADSTSVTPGATGAAIRAATTLLLQGTVAAAAGTLELAGTVALGNTGTILTTAGETLVMTGDTLTAAGSISLVSGATLDLDVPITVPALAGIVRGGGTVVLESTLDATGLTITLDPSSILANVTLASGGVLLGGTYVAAGLVLPLSGTLDGTLSDTTWRGVLDLSGAPMVAVENGLSVTGTAGGPGLILMPGTVNVLDFLTDTTLDNVTITAGNTVANPAISDVSALFVGTSAELALGPSTDVTFTGNLPTGGIIAMGSVSNAGTVAFAGMSSGGGGNIESMLGTTLDNTGLISVADNAVLFYSSDGLPATTFADIGQFAPVALFTNGIAGLLSRPVQSLSSQVQTGASQFQGTITGNGTILAGAGGVAFVNDAVAATQTIAFGSPNAIVAMLNPSAVAARIVGFGVGDALDLTLAGFAGGVLGYSNGTLNIPVAAGTVELTVALATGVTASQLVLAEDAVGGTVVYVACFVGGTHIGTPHGPVPVEALSVGNNVALAGGGTARIVWLGHRRVACARHPRPDSVWPVRIARDSFAPGQPCRDLFLSPDHAVFWDGVLIPVRHLIDGDGIAQIPCDAVEYWHVELERHDVLLAEGLPCESFLDAGNRAAFGNGGVAIEAHPDFSRRIWDADACAPLVVAGPHLAAVRRRLRQRPAPQRAGRQFGTG